MNIYECSETLEIVVGGAIVGVFLSACALLAVALVARTVVATLVAVLTYWNMSKFPWGDMAKSFTRAYFVERWLRSLSPFNHILVDSIDDLTRYVVAPDEEPEE